MTSFTDTSRGRDDPADSSAMPGRAHGAIEAALPAHARSWSQGKRLCFRLLASYFIVYTFPFPLDNIPWIGPALDQGLRWLWVSSTPWVARQVLGIGRDLYLGPTGSGDTTFDYVKLFTSLVLALLAAAVWNLVDRRRRAYPRAARWLVVACRYYLGLVMLVYGVSKVIPTQFPRPSLVRLLTPYGDSSPMGIVWTFMGLSPAYTVFSGLCETVGGMLLFFERTRRLGAAVVAVTMTNVVMLNYAFDVPVKLYSSHLLAMAIALLLVDARRLWGAFVGHRGLAATEATPLFASRRANLAGKAVGMLLVGWLIVQNVGQSWQAYHTFGDGRQRPELYGIWDVDTFRLDGEERPPLLTDDARWRALVVDRALPIKIDTIERPGWIAIQHMNGRITSHSVKLDEAARTFEVLPATADGGAAGAASPGTEAAPPEVLHYVRSEPDRLTLTGDFNGAAIEAQLVRRDLSKMLLIGRGYHWINEQPYNR